MSCRRAPACFATTTPSSRPWWRWRTRSRGFVPTPRQRASTRDRPTVSPRAVAQQEELTERFKSTNALLQNSLSYVGLLSTSPAFGAQDAQLAPATGALAAAILYLRRDTSPDAVNVLQERIDRFAEQAPAVGPDAEAARALLAHARLLQELLPAVDETLKALVAVPSRQPLEEIRGQFSHRQSVVEATAQRFQWLLYLVSLLLLVMLVHLGLQLRARALALRRRAAFEHVIAENSTRLINCPPAEIDARLKQVLGELCRAIGVERGYVVLDENPTRVNAWCADGNGLSAGLAQSGAGDCSRSSARPDPTSSPCRMSPPCRRATSRTRLRRPASAAGPASR